MALDFLPHVFFLLSAFLVGGTMAAAGDGAAAVAAGGTMTKSLGDNKPFAPPASPGIVPIGEGKELAGGAAGVVSVIAFTPGGGGGVSSPGGGGAGAAAAAAAVVVLVKLLPAMAPNQLANGLPAPTAKAGGGDG